MKVRLADNTELQPIMVTGESRYVKGASRDCLSFVFDGTVSMDEVGSIFCEANREIFETIRIIGDDNGEAIYNGYTIRTELKKVLETVENETPYAPTETVERVIVSMAQRTYAETKLAENTAVLSELLGGN